MLEPKQTNVSLENRKNSNFEAIWAKTVGNDSIVLKRCESGGKTKSKEKNQQIF